MRTFTLVTPSQLACQLPTQPLRAVCCTHTSWVHHQQQQPQQSYNPCPPNQHHYLHLQASWQPLPVSNPALTPTASLWRSYSDTSLAAQPITAVPAVVHQRQHHKTLYYQPNIADAVTPSDLADTTSCQEADKALQCCQNIQDLDSASAAVACCATTGHCAANMHQKTPNPCCCPSTSASLTAAT